jgi:amino-acid N-acetyltransferase
MGRALTEAAIRLARQLATPAVYLLTNTAAEFFPRFGFEQITRAEVPPRSSGVERVHVVVPVQRNRHA